MTPVQMPFKRNFKDMENKFEYLKDRRPRPASRSLERLSSLD